MAAPQGYKVDNFAAVVQAIKDILPYLALFYIIDFVLWYMGNPGPSNDASLRFNIMFSSLFIAGFFVIDFFRARGRQKAAFAHPQQVIVVQQPVYMQAPPGYAYPPYPQQGQQGPPPQPPLQPGYGYAPYPGTAPQSQPPPPPPAPPHPDPRKRPPEGSA